MEFPAVRALDDVSVSFEAGEIHGVVGENGAGKSTLMKILGGVQHATSGVIKLDGRPIILNGVRDALRRGIAMIHQELNLVDELTVAENVFLGREATKSGMLDTAKMVEATEAALELLHASFPASEKVGRLSIAGKQLVEIAKAIAVEASILIMDEPTAVLSEPEAVSLFAMIGRLKDRGTTVLYISHRLTEVCEICDRITVLRDGSRIATIDAHGASPSELARLMVGRPIQDFYPAKTQCPTGKLVFELRGFCGVSFSVHRGEILGLAGLVGAGRTELAESIIGARPSGKGELYLDGQLCRIRNPKDAMKLGIAYVSEDRKRLGLHVTLGVVQNISLANLRAYGNVVLNSQKERESARAWEQELDIRAGDFEGPIMNVSGGNQQKIAIAKWLETKPKVLILDEPTRGVDVGAKREMYRLIQRLAHEGMACIVISSELPEIIGLCHRTIIMRDGRVAGELSNDAMSEEAVMHLAAGVEAA